MRDFIFTLFCRWLQRHELDHYLTLGERLVLRVLTCAFLSQLPTFNHQQSTHSKNG